MKRIKVAFVGLAHPHVSALFNTFNFYDEDYEMIGFAEYPLPSPDPANLEKRRARFAEAGIPEYADWKELAAQKPDLAVVNCDNAHREEVCCGLLSMGIHVLDEKPMAMTYAAAAHMCRVARENNVYMLTNWPIAWFPAFRKAKELADAGTVGKVMRVTYRSPATWGPFSYSKDGQLPPDEKLAQSWWYKKEYGGGSILDYACYGAILTSWFFGKKAERVSGIAKNFCTGFSDVEDFSAMILDFGDGVGLLEGSWSTYNPGEVPTGPIIHGTEGVIVCDRHTSCVKVYKGRTHTPLEPTEVIECGTNQQTELLGAHLARVIRREEEPDVFLAEELNLAVVAALDAGRLSAETGVTVKTADL